MEPTSLALTAVLFIAKEFAAGGLKELGKDIYGKIKESLPQDEIIKLNLLEDDSEDKQLQNELASILAERLEERPETAKELQSLLQIINQSSTNVNRQDGETNINLQGNQNTSLNFNQK